jgi:aspartate carbamoyltransferase catalytic subunit
MDGSYFYTPGETDIPINKGLVSIRSLTKRDIESLITKSDAMLSKCQSRSGLDSLNNRIMATLFYEPSTRTRLSFESAMQRLGGGVIGFSDPKSSSVMKGESLADTIRIVSSYSDVIVLRHPEHGAALEALRNSNVPVINAGDGVGQHPTQAILDLFTIKKEKGRVQGLDIALVGDLKNGRTTHSLSYALSLFGNSLTFISPEDLSMPDEIVDGIRSEFGTDIRMGRSLEDAKNADVVYMTRMQTERFNDNVRTQAAMYYSIDAKFVSEAKDGMIIMHPLPRMGELGPEMDALPNSVYFKQAAYGVPVRMAILDSVLSGRI